MQTSVAIMIILYSHFYYYILYTYTFKKIMGSFILLSASVLSYHMLCWLFLSGVTKEFPNFWHEYRTCYIIVLIQDTNEQFWTDYRDITLI